MNSNFNLAEVFVIAKQIERNGIAFYNQAAEKTGNEKLKNLFLHLALEEQKHEVVFESIQNRFAHKTITPEIDDVVAVQYLEAASKMFVFHGQENDKLISDNSKTEADILKFAISRELDSITFFSAVEEALTDSEDKKIIKHLVDEERTHATKLMNVLYEILI